MDDEDYEYLSRWKWWVKESGKTFYAVRGQWVSKTKKVKSILMHRVILNYKGKYPIDHKDNDGLNNQKYNIEISTPSKNALNTTGLIKTNTSGVLGVSWNNQKKKWDARIRVNKKQKSIGYFDTLEEAAMALVNYEPK